MESYLICGRIMGDIQYEVRDAKETCQTVIARLDSAIIGGQEKLKIRAQLIEAKQCFWDLVGLFPHNSFEEAPSPGAKQPKSNT